MVLKRQLKQLSSQKTRPKEMAKARVKGSWNRKVVLSRARRRTRRIKRKSSELFLSLNIPTIIII